MGCETFLIVTSINVELVSRALWIPSSVVKPQQPARSQANSVPESRENAIDQVVIGLSLTEYDWLEE